MDSKAVELKEGTGSIFFLISKLAQKALQQHEKRISTFGSRFEMCLNIMANRSNFGQFTKNLLRGKVVLPSKESANFLSTVGLLDSRVELDKNIEPGTQKYFATISAMASKLAYENNEFIRVTVEERWKMELLGFYNFWDETYKGETTQAFMFRADPKTIFLAFRGTELFNVADWRTDLDLPWYKFPNIKQGNVHRGFMKALALKHEKTSEQRDAYTTILDELKHHLDNNSETKFVLTGHSLGGALAVLYPAVLAMHDEVKVLERLRNVYTFGQPRVGDEEFGRFMKEQIFERFGIGYYRFVYSHDIVPRLPFDDNEMKFKHFGTCIYVNSLYEAEVVDEVPSKNYFDWGSFVTRRADALWEVVRSFLLPRMFGPEYEEGVLLKMFRMFGLVWPGGPAHGPQDYINASRLATYYS